MTRNSYYTVLSHKALLDAWKQTLQKTKPLSKNTVGVDGLSINDFQFNPKDSVAKLYKAVYSKTFQFSELKPYLIPKPNGKLRLICVPTVRDRIVQRVLVDFLSSKYEAQLANDVSFGFVKGRSVKQAAEYACKLRSSYPWIFKTDITAFFDSIDRGTLQAAIEKYVRERSLHPILNAALNCEVAHTNASTARNIALLGVKVGSGVRQGMPLSPLFSNLLLLPFDREIVLSGIKAIRYADDIIFLCKSREECIRASKFCEAELGKLGLKIPSIESQAKSIIYSPEEAAEFLGLELALSENGYDLKLSSCQITRLRTEMLNFGSVKELLSRKITLRTLGAAVAAKKNGYLAAYDACSNIEKVAQDLTAIENKALRNLYQKDLGIDISSISAEARAFLGIT